MCACASHITAKDRDLISCPQNEIMHPDHTHQIYHVCSHACISSDKSHILITIGHTDWSHSYVLQVRFLKKKEVKTLHFFGREVSKEARFEIELFFC
jgi:hypothetical protein